MIGLAILQNKLCACNPRWFSYVYSTKNLGDSPSSSSVPPTLPQTTAAAAAAVARAWPTNMRFLLTFIVVLLFANDRALAMLCRCPDATEDLYAHRESVLSTGGASACSEMLDGSSSSAGQGMASTYDYTDVYQDDEGFYIVEGVRVLPLFDPACQEASTFEQVGSSGRSSSPEMDDDEETEVEVQRGLMGMMGSKGYGYYGKGKGSYGHNYGRGYGKGKGKGKGKGGYNYYEPAGKGKGGDHQTYEEDDYYYGGKGKGKGKVRYGEFQKTSLANIGDSRTHQHSTSCSVVLGKRKGEGKGERKGEFQCLTRPRITNVRLKTTHSVYSFCVPF
jgi:hypothetical protein